MEKPHIPASAETMSEDRNKQDNISASDIYKVLIYNILPLKVYCYCK